MSTLIIRHVPESEFQFEVLEPEGAVTAAVSVRPAKGYPVEGRPKDDLMSELRWYLERFLEYPYSPETEHAERVLAALEGWASEAFASLFGSGEGARIFERAAANGYDELRVQLQCDDPRVLSWPWETLRHPQDGPLALLCRVERSLSGLPEPEPLPAELPRDRINILLVTARPRAQDVSYRAISRPLVELVDRENLPVKVHLLRPPTFERLAEHLAERPGYYHILHFDGHGEFKNGVGYLVFEDAEIGGDGPVSAERLNALLGKYEVPLVVLNACQSGMLDDSAETAFASVAASLLRGRTRSVVAMAYSLYVSAAQEFLPNFYHGLFVSGALGSGVRAGRASMAKSRGRICVRGRFDLDDWLVPVIYQRGEVDLAFAETARPTSAESAAQVMDFGLEIPLGRFVGRDGAILQLERSMRSPIAGILVSGLGGAGKTTLVRGFVDWLARTEGIESGCFWLGFQEIRSEEYLWNRLGDYFFENFSLLNTEQKIDMLARVLRENNYLIVWDNFEAFSRFVSEDVREHLRSFLAMIRGGRTKVLITSRGEEGWLGRERQVISLGGLAGEERWAFCEAIFSDLGMDPDRKNPQLKDLIDSLRGHPLSMRVVLGGLDRCTVEEMTVHLRSNAELLDITNRDTAHLYAALRFVEERLDDRLKPLLLPLALHEHSVNRGYLEAMLRRVELSCMQPDVDSLLQTLSDAGLLRPLGFQTFEMHPVLTGFLRSVCLRDADTSVRSVWEQGFVICFANVAEILVKNELKVQSAAMRVDGVNLLYALQLGRHHGMAAECMDLLVMMSDFYLNDGLLSEAESKSLDLLRLAESQGNVEVKCVALHVLGRVSQERRDFSDAQRWYVHASSCAKAAMLWSRVAVCSNQLGVIAEERRDFISAEKWYLESLAAYKELYDSRGAFRVCYNLGSLAEARHDLHAAEEWYSSSLDWARRHGDKDFESDIYHQLGRVAEKRGDLDAAEKQYVKSLSLGDVRDKGSTASILLHLGAVEQMRRNYEAAESWCMKSLKLEEERGAPHGVARSCGQLGNCAFGRGDLSAAEKWYMKSLAVLESLGDDYHIAITYDHLGMIAMERCQLEVAQEWYRKALQIKESSGDINSASSTYHNLGNIFQKLHKLNEAEEWHVKSLDIKESYGDKRGMAAASHHLGMIAQERKEFDSAMERYHDALELFEELGDKYAAANTYANLGRMAGECNMLVEAGKCSLRALVGFMNADDIRNMQHAAEDFINFFRQSSIAEQAELHKFWIEVGLPWPEGLGEV